VIGTGAGASADVNFGLLMRKRGRIHGSTLRARTNEEKAEVIGRLGAFMQGQAFTVPVEATFPLERAQEAYDRFAAGGKFGKLVIVP
jgi:NADPH:quinone reductase-like Zn-dependent oxidoreductase